jgi:hypothetical protein
LDRAKSHVASLREAGITLDSAQEERFIKLFKTASDEQVEDIKALAIQAAAVPVKEEEKPIVEAEVTAEPKVEAKDDGSDDADAETRLEATASRKSVPMGKGNEEDPTLARHASPKARELVKALREAYEVRKPKSQ